MLFGQPFFSTLAHFVRQSWCSTSANWSKSKLAEVEIGPRRVPSVLDGGLGEGCARGVIAGGGIGSATALGISAELYASFRNLRRTGDATREMN